MARYVFSGKVLRDLVFIKFLNVFLKWCGRAWWGMLVCATVGYILWLPRNRIEINTPLIPIHHYVLLSCTIFALKKFVLSMFLYRARCCYPYLLSYYLPLLSLPLPTRKLSHTQHDHFRDWLRRAGQSFSRGVSQPVGTSSITLLYPEPSSGFLYRFCTCKNPHSGPAYWSCTFIHSNPSSKTWCARFLSSAQ